MNDGRSVANHSKIHSNYLPNTEKITSLQWITSQVQIIWLLWSV